MFVSMVVWVVLVTKLEREGMARFRKSVADFSIYLGDDGLMNRRRSPSFSCISNVSACTEKDYTYRVASPSLTRPSVLILAVIVLIISV